MKNLLESTLVPLTPRGWVPNPNITGGNTAPETLWIDVGYWDSIGRPGSIEEFYEKTEKARTEFLNTINFRGFTPPKTDA